MVCCREAEDGARENNGEDCGNTYNVSIAKHATV